MIERTAVLFLLVLSSCVSQDAKTERSSALEDRMAELATLAKERDAEKVKSASRKQVAMLDPSEGDGMSERLDALAQRVLELERTIAVNEVTISQLVSMSRPTEAILDPVQRKGASAWGDYGCFVANVVSVSPDADGVAVRLRVGNLAAAHLSNCVLVVRWGRRFPFAVAGVPFEQAYSDWEAELKTVRVVVPQTLRSGEWTPVEVGLPGAVVAELGHIRVAVEASVVVLLE